MLQLFYLTAYVRRLFPSLGSVVALFAAAIKNTLHKTTCSSKCECSVLATIYIFVLCVYREV